MGRFFSSEKDTKFTGQNPELHRPAEREKKESAETKPVSAETCVERLDSVLRKKEYQHWESKEAQEENRRQIVDYDHKKREVQRASLETQRSILTRYGDRFDQENMQRMHSEIGSNKIEIYNEPYFVTEKVPDISKPVKVLGMRDFPDGKICIRDGEDLAKLKHVSTHETMHDLSYQHSDHNTKTVQDTLTGQLRTVSKTELSSGIHRVETTRQIVDGKPVGDAKDIHYNRYLNEGITELYTIEEMQRRGEQPDFASYTQEVGWVLNLRDKVGDDLIADAYFGGNLEALRQKVNDMSDISDAWDNLSLSIDEYNRALEIYSNTGDLHYKNRAEQYKQAADYIIDSLQGSRVLVKRR